MPDDDAAPPQDQPAQTGPDDAPTADELAAVAEPVPVRRAPRYRSFVGTGAFVGMLTGTALVLLDPPAVAPTDPTAAGTGVVLLFVCLGLGIVGALLGAALAVFADRSGHAPR